MIQRTDAHTTSADISAIEVTILAVTAGGKAEAEYDSASIEALYRDIGGEG